MAIVRRLKDFFESTQTTFENMSFEVCLKRLEYRYNIAYHGQQDLHPSQRRAFPEIRSAKTVYHVPEYCDQVKAAVYETYYLLPDALQSLICVNRTKFSFGEDNYDFMDDLFPPNIIAMNEGVKEQIEAMKKEVTDQLSLSSAFLIQQGQSQHKIMVAHHNAQNNKPDEITNKAISENLINALALYVSTHLSDIYCSTKFINAVLNDVVIDATITMLDDDFIRQSDPNALVDAQQTMHHIQNNRAAFIKKNEAFVHIEAKKTFIDSFRHYINHRDNLNHPDYAEFQAKRPNASALFETIMMRVEDIVVQTHAKYLPNPAQQQQLH